ncbi:HK97 gp10 family phage protein [Actinomadura litoris]|uniref:HK97 gp10 family phage protein n=1 Tax=Actinomadura litoris TaxID=2678616 RepID=UPI001FA6AB8E|nr:HK97 gp10 family phage protein [Actinomadura litoris]
MIEFDVGEIDRLADDLAAAGPRARGRAVVVTTKSGHDTVSDAQAVVAVDTGALKNSIGVDVDPDGLGFEAGSKLGYSGHVEFGTSRMAPQPYLLPSFDRRAELAIAALTEIAADVL